MRGDSSCIGMTAGGAPPTQGYSLYGDYGAKQAQSEQYRTPPSKPTTLDAEESVLIRGAHRRKDVLVRRRAELNEQIDILTQFMRVFED